MTDPSNKRTMWQQFRLWLARVAVGVGVLALLYASFLLLGFAPVNRGYLAPPSDDRVRVFVRSNGVHTDLVLPVLCDEVEVDWRRLFPLRDFWGNAEGAEYVAVGWGNREFYLHTKTWADFKLSTACMALFWPSETVLHVEYLMDVSPGEQMRPILLTREQYRQLASFVQASVGATNDQGAATIASDISYGSRDRFYEASGRYHLFSTCNQWTGRGLKQAGVPTGIWTPLEPQVLYWLPTLDD